MYPGMILPAGSRYKICNNAGNNGGCGGWNDNTADRCIRGNGSQGCGNASWIIPGYVRTANGATTDTQNLGIGGNNHLEVQIAYLPATVWVQSKNAGALAANESWGPILPGQTTATRLIRIDITSATTSYAKAGTRSDCVGATCSYAEELTNFSNWFAYYRKRHMYLNAATGIAFDQVTGIRVGQFVFNNRNDVTMYDFDNTNDNANARRLLYDLYRIKGTGGTPTRESLEHAGRQFQRTGTSAPIQAACQYNAAFVITDGFANASGPTSYGNADSNASNRFTVPYDINNPDLNYNDPPPAPPGNISRPSPLGGPALPAVTVTPAPPYPDGFSNTMADIAMYFYSTNLRSDLTTRQVVVNPGDTGREADRNDMLHMNTFALGLGVQGVVFGRNDSATVIAQNQDPYTNPPDWNAIGDPRQFDRNPRAVDDLWHATINGRGKMLSASAPEEARSGVVDVINNVGARGGAGAAVAVANPNLFPGDNFSYASSYNSGAWSGDLNKYAVDLSTGQPSTTGLWTPSPQKQLATRVPTTRLIATTNPSGGGGGVPVGTPFQWNNLNATQQTLLGSDSQVLDFLRGDRSREVDKFRSRGPRPQRDAGGNFVLDGTGRYVYVNNITPDNVAVLGDIINAEPVVVRNPTRSYFDAGYGEFRTTQSGRAGVVYQGGNDGMLHAFSVEDGTELWAYVPSWTFPTLRNLSDRTGFRHLYYVDGTPAVGDVDFGRVGGSIGTPDWRTILVGGLRKGGFGYYALDITNPSAGSETDVANKVLWEFPNDSNPTLMSTVERRNVGYSFGKPVIVKTRAHGWVALVTSGYNNGNTGVGSSGGDGRGYLYVLNARTGALLKVMETQAGTADTPSGLGPISAFISRPAIDATAEAIYGGDLLGNVWRFDVSSANPDLWTVTRLAALRSTSGGPASTGIQPITTEPELGTINRKRVVFVGGGQYLGDSDAMQTAGTIPPENAYTRRTMSFYALRDDLSTPVFPTPVISDVRSLQQQTVTVSGDLLNITNTAVNFNTQAGWFFDFPRTGERAVTNPILSGGVVVFTTNIPDRFDLCNPGGSSWAYFVDYQTGGLIPGAISAGQKI
ncbi:MAG: hypothetical protein KIT73_16780, partial [Burkholderiales bacterium]|nr:hypothetical protein [Burkholderiales bacterium]